MDSGTRRGSRSSNMGQFDSEASGRAPFRRPVGGLPNNIPVYAARILPASIRLKFHFGPYRAPRFKLGAIVEDEIRGAVTVVGLTDARIPWPIARKGKYRALLVDKTLVAAIRRESVQAVAFWWGISVETVHVYRSRPADWPDAPGGLVSAPDARLRGHKRLGADACPEMDSRRGKDRHEPAGP
jgi:hypothetical protein